MSSLGKYPFKSRNVVLQAEVLKEVYTVPIPILRARRIGYDDQLIREMELQDELSKHRGKI
jgi:hypothetical protein